MRRRQYTVRGVPGEVDRALRKRAEEENKSINAALVEAITRGLELDAPPAVHSDLDDLIGSWREDAGFECAVAEFAKVDEDMWR